MNKIFVHLFFCICGMLWLSTKAFAQPEFRITRNNNPIPNGSFESKCSGDLVVFAIDYNPSFTNFKWYNVANPSVVLSTADTFGVATAVSVTGLEEFIAMADSAGSPVYDTLRLQTRIKPGVKLKFDDTIICPGQTVVMSNTHTNTGTLKIKYTWNRLAFGSFRIPVGSSSTLVPTDSGLYELRISYDELFNSCGISDFARVRFQARPIFSAGTDSSVCPGGKAYLIAKAIQTGALPYQKVRWYPRQMVLDSTALRTEAEVINTQVFTLMVTDARGCKDTATVRYTAQQAPQALAPFADTILCLGKSVRLNVLPSGGNPYKNSSPYRYQWTPASGLESTVLKEPLANPSANTLYEATVRDSTGCLAKAQIFVRRSDLKVELPQKVAGLSICDGTTAELTAKGTGSGDTTQFQYQWSPSGLFPGNENGKSIRTTAINTTRKALVRLSYKGCSVVDSIQIGIRNLPVVLGSPRKDTVPCSGEFASFNASASGGTGTLYTYAWKEENGNALASTASANLQLPFGQLSKKFLVEASDESGCVSAPDSVFLLSVDAPSVRINLPNGRLCADSALEFSAQVQQASKIQWRFLPGGTSSTSFNPQVNFADFGPAFVHVQVENATGCKASDSLNFEVILCAAVIQKVFVPNAFRPSSDVTENQSLRIFGESIDDADFLFQVYNAWGELLYQTPSKKEAQAQGWDGKFKGAEAPAGVYTYYLKGKYYNKTEFSAKGTAILLR